MRAPRIRIPARQVRCLPAREAGGVQLQAPRLVPELWRATHVRDRRPPRRACAARAAHPSVSRTSKRPNSSRRSSPISPRARPAASITPAHHRPMRLSPNARPPPLQPCPDCARGCTPSPLRLASRALRSPAPSRHAFLCAGSKSRHLDRDSCDASALEPMSNPTTTGPILPQPSQSTPYSSYPSRLAYITPSCQFPLGATLSLERRLLLLDWAERIGAFVVEDDYDSEYRYRGRPPAAVQGIDSSGRVASVGTFSKTMFPALRVGYVIAPHGLEAAFAHAVRNTGQTVPPPVRERDSPWRRCHRLLAGFTTGDTGLHLGYASAFRYRSSRRRCAGSHSSFARR